MEHTQDQAALLAAFHLTWDGFPGVARLIDRNSKVLAVNPCGLKAGHKEGETCSKVGKPEMHRSCLKAQVLRSQEPGLDRPNDQKIRGWVPIQGFPDLVVHFALVVPETGKNNFNVQ